MTSSFVAYIDESGDEGFTFRADGSGSSRWFVLSALVIRKENDLRLVQAAKEARRLIRFADKKPIHFCKLRHEQRTPVSRIVGELPIRTVNILIHKPCIVEPEIFQQQAYSLYRYASRLLLERVSWLCRDNHDPRRGNGQVELIYSNRSAMSYEDLRNYIGQLHVAPGAQHVTIDWNVVSEDLVRAVNHDQLAGLQLADVVASSVYQAVNPNLYGDVEGSYLVNLRRTIYRHRNRKEGYGLKFWCGCDPDVQRVLALVQA
ncbi:DUF3800 domain-containing protein [Pseudomonas aeruginosa]|uniref:DUF3800 domain-containing protein n=1 Tax=Pseudomonas aeruginosa TaxID=287 RepID=UPI00053E4350|nr:DUF3800 domain-containing protein [Pseudomonas aeruginosa]ELF7083927.1 DUF3800 domain-containing protein [Pseudomonas aeruginosa]ELF7093171.1 DUF3800 domain-containing protein [Pseudomonas aeruginosa]ELG8230854.1 DUF3800 domain-containing protein [Pseudomonas aeruginosa]ELJ9603340.1 DUF3800 domain-containing protein [Pseudomonas aeruginosa]MBD3148960.1 DUF3800 domain-containing protein [Pseudomonas aeruginosa]